MSRAENGFGVTAVNECTRSVQSMKDAASWSGSPCALVVVITSAVFSHRPLIELKP